jgi:hypothetical protein
MALTLPSETRKPKENSPNIMLIYGMPKGGKTTICSYLKNHLILELESGGADYVEGRVLELNKPSEFNEALGILEQSTEKVCDYLVVDTTTKMDEWAEIVGTYNYMSKPQGKKFNREGEQPNGIKILHNDPRFETVHELGQGFGYQHSRQVMVDWYDRLLNLITLKKVRKIILIAHIKDKLVESKTGDAVDAIDINLTGKVKSIYASRVDAIAFFNRKGTQGYLNFDNEFKVLSGGRCPHLDGKILISEKVDGKLVTYWDKIYLD